MPEPVDVYLLAGQSNMTGHGQPHELPEPLRVPHASALMHFVPLNEPGHDRLDRPHVRRWAPLEPGCGDAPGGFGLELSLGHTLAARSPRRVALIKADRGGTGLFNHWQPDRPDDPSTLTRLTLTAAAEALEQLYEDGYDPRFAGFFWFQGERDTRPDNPAPDRYTALLGALIEQVVDELNDGQPFPKLYFRIQVPSPPPPAPHAESIRQQLVAHAQADPLAAWIDTDD
ncbi:MAG: sialate O-acetylesterase, partial [Planctomycetota bacterium]